MEKITPFIPILIFFAIISIPFILARIKSKKDVVTVICPKCLTKTTGKLKVSFTGLKRIKCQSCENTIKSPLSWGMRIVYIVVLLLLFFGMLEEFNIVALLFIVLILIAFSIDLKTILSNKKAKEKINRL